MLNRKAILIIAVQLLFFASTAWCADAGQLSDNPRELFPASEFKLGYQGTYLYYDEPDVMHEKGFLNGGFVAWTGYFTDQHIMAAIELEGVAGGMRYYGKYSDGTRLKCDTDDYLLSGRLTVGKGFEVGGVGVTPYIGFGTRYWYDRIKAAGGYKRYIHQYYLPLGVNVVYRLDANWSLGGSIEGDLFLGGTVKSKLSDVGPDYQDADNSQDFLDGFGARISLFAEYQFEACALGFEPYFRYWKLDDSDKDTVRFGDRQARVYEPENKFYMSGIRLYLKY